MIHQTENRRCFLYVLNTLADWEIAFITAELKSGRYIPKNIKFNLITMGSSLETIETMGGLPITPEMAIDDIEFKEGDLLVLPGADTWMEEKNNKILDILPGLLQKQVIVAAICGATAGLARTGLLSDKRHTSINREYLAMVCPGYRGSHYYVDAPVVVDENLITATGLAPLEFSYEVFKKIKAMKADTLEAWYQLYLTREPKYFYSLMESL